MLKVMAVVFAVQTFCLVLPLAFAFFAYVHAGGALMQHQTAETLRAMARGIRDVFDSGYTTKHGEADACEAGARSLELLDALVKKLDEVHASPQFTGVWANSPRYAGPQYKDELDTARAFINAESPT